VRLRIGKPERNSQGHSGAGVLEGGKETVIKEMDGKGNDQGVLTIIGCELCRFSHTKLFQSTLKNFPLSSNFSK
jgi:hypothetical protein